MTTCDELRHAEDNSCGGLRSARACMLLMLGIAAVGVQALMLSPLLTDIAQPAAPARGRSVLLRQPMGLGLRSRPLLRRRAWVRGRSVSARASRFVVMAVGLAICGAVLGLAHAGRRAGRSPDWLPASSFRAPTRSRPTSAPERALAGNRPGPLRLVGGDGRRRAAGRAALGLDRLARHLSDRRRD